MTGEVLVAPSGGPQSTRAGWVRRAPKLDNRSGCIRWRNLLTAVRRGAGRRREYRRRRGAGSKDVGRARSTGAGLGQGVFQRRWSGWGQRALALSPGCPPAVISTARSPLCSAWHPVAGAVGMWETRRAPRRPVRPPSTPRRGSGSPAPDGAGCRCTGRNTASGPRATRPRCGSL